MNKFIKQFLIILPVLSFSCLADWQLQTDNSSVTFVSTKQSHINEVHQIQSFDVSVTDNKAIAIKLDLSSIESGIPIRNDRMKAMLFDVANFRYATLSLALPDALENIKSATRYSITAMLDIKGKKAPMQLDILIAPGKDTVTATLLKPVIVTAQQFGLDKGVDALREIAGLNSVGYAVPVSATIVLSKV